MSRESPPAGRLVKFAPEPWNVAAVTELLAETLVAVAVTMPTNTAFQTRSNKVLHYHHWSNCSIFSSRNSESPRNCELLKKVDTPVTVSPPPTTLIPPARTLTPFLPLQLIQQNQYFLHLHKSVTSILTLPVNESNSMCCYIFTAMFLDVTFGYQLSC